ncbi:MAG: AraC family ligand binding domain-containing protein [Nevskia sp.]|nr:AraC family ligand binding domain-containing protein [Nevskia sp.]
MTELRVYRENGERLLTCSGFDEICGIVEQTGAHLEHWPKAAGATGAHAAPAQVIEDYRDQVDRLMQRYGFQSVDVVSMWPGHPRKHGLRDQFLGEHTHDDFEVRFFISGQALFYIHAGGLVYGLLCGPGDIIAVPAGAPHWFDMGPSPSFQCIRLFSTPEGWAAKYTGDTIPNRFPRLEQPHYDAPQAAEAAA